MRTPLTLNEPFILHNTNNFSADRRIIVKKVLGMGANVVAYEAEDFGGNIRFILKECFPETGANRMPDGTIVWKNSEVKNKAMARMTKAYEMQLELQRSENTENTNTHLIDALFTANGTLYSLTDHKNADIYASHKDETLQEIMITARSVAKAVKAYHDSGFLHLDIKPQNIMILPETRDIILLLDFDSIVRKNDVLTSDISYSPAFAAPEQLQGRADKICEATDVYAIGALIFSMIFGKSPVSSDRSSFSSWDYSESLLYDKLSNKCKTLTNEVFHRSLAASIKSRYKNMDELIPVLNELVKESDPQRRFINSSLRIQRNIFLTRKETREIHKQFLSGKVKTVFLYGTGGMGKTELAIHFANKYRSNFNVICFGKYTSNLRDLFADKSFINIENDPSTPSLESVRALLCPNDLLIIDNMDTFDDGNMDELLSLDCKIIITSRLDFRNICPSAAFIHVGPLEEEEQFTLFEKEFGDVVPDGEADNLQRIKNSTGGNTLLIALLAKLCRRGCISISEAADRIVINGPVNAGSTKLRHYKDINIYGSIGSIMGELFNMSSLSREEHYVMGSMALLDAPVISKRELLRLIGEEYCDAVNCLLDYNWLQPVGPEHITMHKAIYETYLSEFHPDCANFEWVSTLCDELASYEETPRKFNHSHELYSNDVMTHLYLHDIHIYRILQQRAEIVKRVLSHFSNDSELSIRFVLNYYCSIAQKCENIPTRMVDYLAVGDDNYLRALKTSYVMSLNCRDIADLFLTDFLCTISNLIGGREEDNRSKQYVEKWSNHLFEVIDFIFVSVENLELEIKKEIIDKIYVTFFYANYRFGTELFYLDFPETVYKPAVDKYRDYCCNLVEKAKSLSCECIAWIEHICQGRLSSTEALLFRMKDNLYQESKAGQEAEEQFYDDWAENNYYYNAVECFTDEMETLKLQRKDRDINSYRCEREIYRLCSECEKVGFGGVLSNSIATADTLKIAEKRENYEKALSIVNSILEVDATRIKENGGSVAFEYGYNLEHIYLLAMVVYLYNGDEEKAEQQIVTTLKYWKLQYRSTSLTFRRISQFLSEYGFSQFINRAGIVLSNRIKGMCLEAVNVMVYSTAVLTDTYTSNDFHSLMYKLFEIAETSENSIDLYETGSLIIDALKERVSKLPTANVPYEDFMLKVECIRYIIWIAEKTGNVDTAEKYRRILSNMDNPLELYFS